MNETTRYRYEKRIESLQREVNRLRPYEDLAVNVFQNVTDRITDGRELSHGWIVKQFRQVFR